MAKLSSTLLVAGLILIAGVSVGTSAFTTADIDRQANVNVVADDTGLLGLTDGNSGNLVFQNADDQLEIDFTNGNASGANTDALFSLGDGSNPSGSQAFIITNNDAETHTINATYNANTAAADTDNLKFDIYDESNTLVGTVSAAGDTASLTTSPGESYNVVVTVDTGHGGSTVLKSGDDLSGTLEFRIDDTQTGGN